MTRRVVGGANSHPPILSSADSSAQFEKVTKTSPAPPVRPWNQLSVAQHTQTPLRAPSQGEPPEPRPCIPPSLPHCGYSYGPVGPACAVSASLVSAPQSISLAYSDHQARLCDSVLMQKCILECIRPRDWFAAIDLKDTY